MMHDQNHIKFDNSSFDGVEEFKYLRKLYQIIMFIQEEFKIRLQSGNACYNSVQNFLSSSLPLKIKKIKIYRTIILPVVLYGCETWSVTVKEKSTLMVFKDKLLRRIFGPKKD